MLLQTAQEYKKVFENNGLDVQIMPLRHSNKNPVFKHKGGAYTPEKEKQVLADQKHWIDEKKACNLGWLMNDQLFCLDLDGAGTTPEEKEKTAANYFQMFQEKFDLTGAWIERTRKGYHLIWKKPEQLKEVTLATDAFKQAGFPGIDLVTVTGSSHNNIPTKAVLCVYPSTNKVWLDSNSPLTGHQLKEPPNDLTEWILRHRRTTAQRRVTGEERQEKKSIQIRKRVKGHGSPREIQELKLILDELPSTYYEDTGNGGDWNLWFKVMVGVQYLMGDDGYETWVAFNKKAQCWTPEMEESNKTRYWDKHIGEETTTPIKMGSFRYWIRTDNPAAWIEIGKQNLLNYHVAAFYGSWYELAEMSSLELPNIVYNKITNRWCKFEDGVWDTDYQRLIVDLNSDVRVNFEKTLESRFQEWYKGEDPDRAKAKITRVGLKFSSNPEKVVSQLKSICSKEIVFDENPWLIGVKGGWVYDLRKKCFRKAKKEDYVSKAVGFIAEDIINVSQELMDELENVLEDILPIQEQREYQLYLLALSLNGIEAKRFSCQNGSGANGKSTLFGLLKVALGDYCKNVSTEHYTTRFSQSGPRPDLLDFQGTRLFIATEPSEGERFNSGSIKKLTGGDPIRCRGMYFGETLEFYCVGQHNVLCNDLPNLSGVDGGIRRRIVNFRYPTKFVKNPDPNNKFEKLINVKFKSQEWFQQMGAAVLKLLFELHDRYLELGQAEYQLDPPKSLTILTDEWISNSIDVREVIEEYYLPNPESSERISAKDLYAIYRESDSYQQLSKKEKRLWGKKYSLQKLEEVNPLWAAAKVCNNQGTWYTIDNLIEPKELEI